MAILGYFFYIYEVIMVNFCPRFFKFCSFWTTKKIKKCSKCWNVSHLPHNPLTQFIFVLICCQCFYILNNKKNSKLLLFFVICFFSHLLTPHPNLFLNWCFHFLSIFVHFEQTKQKKWAKNADFSWFVTIFSFLVHFC